MGFSKGNYCRIWKLENKGNYHVAQISTSKKNKQTDQYETDWQDSFVRLVGTAHTQAQSFNIGDKGMSAKIGACDVTNKYDKEKRTTYTNYVIFGFEEIDGNNGGNNQSKAAPKKDDGFINIPDGADEELPFN